MSALSSLWTEIANQKRIENPIQENDTFKQYPIVDDTNPIQLSPDAIRRSAVICPVNNNFDFAAARNAHLFKERFESAWGFDTVVVEESARSSQAKPSAAIVAVLAPLVEAVLSGRHFDNNSENNTNRNDARKLNRIKAIPVDQRSHLVVIYITCSTPVDIAEIYDGLAQVVIGQEDELINNNNSSSFPYFPSKACIIVDAPCTAPLQVAPGAQLPIPLLVPRADFDGHLAIKFLHAANGCGDNNFPITLEEVASRITPMATLMGVAPASHQSPASKKSNNTNAVRIPWNFFACPSSQSVTFLTCCSLEPLEKETLGAIDGRNVGKALKQLMPSARLRYLVEKEQTTIINFNDEDTFRPPEIVLHHEDCAAEFEAALAMTSRNVRLGAVLPTADRRFIASVVPSETNTVQQEIEKLFDAVTDHSIRMQVPQRIPSKTFTATNLALAYKYEVTATYRTYLVLEALVRLHIASPEHRLRVEDLTPPMVTAEGVDAGSISSFMYVRAGVSAAASGVSPRRQMMINNNNNNRSATSSPQQRSSTQRQLLSSSSVDNENNNNISALNVSAASPQQQQHLSRGSATTGVPLSENQSQNNMVASNNNGPVTLTKQQQQEIVAQVLAATGGSQQQNANNIRKIIQEEMPPLVRQAVQESNMQMANQFQQAMEQLRAEFFIEMRKTSEALSADIRDTESRWKKHLLLMENRLKKMEDRQDEQEEQQMNNNAMMNSPPRRAAGGTNSNINNSTTAASPITIKREIAAALDSVGAPLQQLDQKVSSLASRLDSTNERLLSLEDLVASNQRNMSSAQDHWMTQRDQQLQQFSQNLTDTLEQRLSNFVPEGRMRIAEERIDDFMSAKNNNNKNGSGDDKTSSASQLDTSAAASPSRALTERLSSIEATAEQAKRDCASFEQKLAHLEDSTKRLITQSEEGIKTDLSTSVNRFSSDLSQRLVTYLNDSISRVNTDLGSIRTSMFSQIDGSVSMKLQNHPLLLLKNNGDSNNNEEMLDYLQMSVKRSSSDLRDLRARVQELEIGKSNVQKLSEEDKSKVQRIIALEEQVGRLTNFIRNM